MEIEVVTVQPGHPRYEELVGQIRTDYELHRQMWADAEHQFVERAGKSWTIVAVRDGDRWVPEAWACAYVETDDDGTRVLRCCDNYERREHRGRGLYAAAYAERHRTVVGPSGLPAVSFLFAQPIGLHEADGWYRTGLAGTSEGGHDWWELRRDPS